LTKYPPSSPPRPLPSWWGVYFLLALGLFPHLGHAKVWDEFVAGPAGPPVAVRVTCGVVRDRFRLSERPQPHPAEVSN